MIGLDASEKEWRTEADLETLMRAEEIRKDAKRMSAAKALAKKRYSQLEAAGLCGHKDKKPK